MRSLEAIHCRDVERRHVLKVEPPSLDLYRTSEARTWIISTVTVELIYNFKEAGSAVFRCKLYSVIARTYSVNSMLIKTFVSSHRDYSSGPARSKGSIHVI